jgi:hypothetical protein
LSVFDSARYLYPKILPEDSSGYSLLTKKSGVCFMQHRGSRELWIALLIILIITFFYLFVVILQGSVPAAREFIGHTLGIIGFILMLITETLYSIRKRNGNAKWGMMASWLNFHIVTGLVGPYLVLLHTSWKFNGLAGILTLLTAIVVLSGFIGRYIYTAVPRTADGIELENSELEMQIMVAQAELDRWLATQNESTRRLAIRLSQNAIESHSESGWILGRFLYNRRFHRFWHKEIRKLDPKAQKSAVQLELLLNRRRQLDQQIESLAAARRLLALWHAVHIPIGLALFTAAFIHIFAAVYFATLLR